jgi:hypothetical protein
MGGVFVPELKKSREEIIAKAGELAVAYEAQYKGCSQSTFLAIVDALRWGGFEIIPEDMEERFFPGISLFAGGVNSTSDGTCGAVIASIMAIGMAVSILQGFEGRDMRAVSYATEGVNEAILDKFNEKYRSQICKDILRERYGKSWDLKRPDMLEEFLGISEGCAIKETAVMAVEFILDEIEQSR